MMRGKRQNTYEQERLQGQSEGQSEGEWGQLVQCAVVAEESLRLSRRLWIISCDFFFLNVSIMSINREAATITHIYIPNAKRAKRVMPRKNFIVGKIYNISEKRKVTKNLIKVIRAKSIRDSLGNYIEFRWWQQTYECV